MALTIVGGHSNRNHQQIEFKLKGMVSLFTISSAQKDVFGVATRNKNYL